MTTRLRTLLGDHPGTAALKSGAVKSDSGGFRIPVPEKGGNPAIPFAAQIPVATLEPGTYQVVLVAVDNANNKFERKANFTIQ